MAAGIIATFQFLHSSGEGAGHFHATTPSGIMNFKVDTNAVIKLNGSNSSMASHQKGDSMLIEGQPAVKITTTR